MTEAEAVQAIIAMGRGARPYSMDCREAEDALGVALAALIELSVANDRIDRLERMVADLRGEPVDALRAARPDTAAAAERAAATDALMARALRFLLDPREPAPRPGATSSPVSDRRSAPCEPPDPSRP